MARIALVDQQPVPATKPCTSMAGSAERIEAYRQRYERGEQIFHDGDHWEVVVVSLASKPKECSIREINLRQLRA